jgi:hypothetical protein
MPIWCGLMEASQSLGWQQKSFLGDSMNFWSNLAGLL